MYLEKHQGTVLIASKKTHWGQTRNASPSVRLSRCQKISKKIFRGRFFLRQKTRTGDRPVLRQKVADALVQSHIAFHVFYLSLIVTDVLENSSLMENLFKLLPMTTILSSSVLSISVML